MGSDMGSEIKFYKISEKEYVFSVKSVSEYAIRYYHISYDSDNLMTVSRIRNSMAFFNEHKPVRIAVFSPDYIKLVISLIDFCDQEVNNEVSNEQVASHRAGFRQGTFAKRREIHAAEVTYSQIPDGAVKVVSSRASKNKQLQNEAEEYYSIDIYDKDFILVGISNNNLINTFRTKI